MIVYVFENQRTKDWDLHKSSDLVIHRTSEEDGYRVVKDRYGTAGGELIPSSDISKFIANYRQKFE